MGSSLDLSWTFAVQCVHLKQHLIKYDQTHQLLYPPPIFFGVWQTNLDKFFSPLLHVSWHLVGVGVTGHFFGDHLRFFLLHPYIILYVILILKLPLFFKTSQKWAANCVFSVFACLGKIPKNLINLARFLCILTFEMVVGFSTFKKVNSLEYYQEFILSKGIFVYYYHTRAPHRHHIYWKIC